VKYFFSTLGETITVQFEKVQWQELGTQQEPNNSTGNNQSLHHDNVIAKRFESSVAQAALKKDQGGNTDIPRHLTELQRKEVELSPTMVATMGCSFEEQQNEMANHIVKQIYDVIRH